MKKAIKNKILFNRNTKIVITIILLCGFIQFGKGCAAMPNSSPSATETQQAEATKLEITEQSPTNTVEPTATLVPQEKVTAEELGIDNSFTEEEFNVLIKGNMQKLISVHRKEGNAFLTFLVDYVSGDTVIRNHMTPYALQNGELASGLDSHIWHDPDADRMVDAYTEQYIKYVNGERISNWDPNGEYNQFFLLVKAEDEYGEYNFVVPMDGGYWIVQDKPMYAPANEVDGVPTNRMKYIPLSDVSQLTPQEREWAQQGFMVFDYRYGDGIGRGDYLHLK